jgi:hypothetical protein
VLPTLVALEASPSSSEDLSTKARRSLKSIVSKVGRPSVSHHPGAALFQLVPPESTQG